MYGRLVELCEIQEGWMGVWMDKCKFEIVFVVSQMYGWMD